MPGKNVFPFKAGSKTPGKKHPPVLGERGPRQIDIDAGRTIVVIYGQSGQGKSHLAKRFQKLYGMKQIVDDWRPGDEQPRAYSLVLIRTPNTEFADGVSIRHAIADGPQGSRIFRSIQINQARQELGESRNWPPPPDRPPPVPEGY